MSPLTRNCHSAVNGLQGFGNDFLGPNTDKIAVRGIVILVIYAAVKTLIAAASKPFWYDEVLTWILARQPSVRAIWNSLESAADSQGPAFYVIESAMSAIIPNQEIALRLPSILGYCCLILCIFVFVRRRVGSGLALICAVVPFMTVLFRVYAIEARAYSLFVACDAVALVCYQRASSWRWTSLMALCLALAQSLHYYAVFALAPIGLAETVRLLRARDFRIGVWLALLCGAAPLAIFWPLLWRLREVYGANYGGPPGLFTIARMYGTFFETSWWWGVSVIGVLGLGVINTALPFATRTGEAAPEAESIFDEHVLVFALLCIPLGGYVTTKVANVNLLFRHVLPALLGVPLALAYILATLERRTIALFMALLVFSVGAQEGLFWLTNSRHVTTGESQADSVEHLVEVAGHSDLPVVVSDGFQFLPLVHYAEPLWRDRFVCLVDPKHALAYMGMDVVDNHLAILRRLAPIHVYDFPAFAKQHPTFLLYSDYSPDEPFDWWPDRLVHDGDNLRLLASDHSRKVYLVNMRNQQ